jgi:hypothetical protein
MSHRKKRDNCKVRKFALTWIACGALDLNGLWRSALSHKRKSFGRVGFSIFAERKFSGGARGLIYYLEKTEIAQDVLIFMYMRLFI